MPHSLSHSRIVIAAFGAFVFFAAPLRAEVIDIDNAELARLSAAGIPVVDIRTPGEWKSTGVIAGSRLLTFFDENGGSDTARWLASAKGFATPGQPVILICRSGGRTRAATQFLSQQAGYATVYNVKQGMNGWLAEQRPVVPSEKAIACKPGTPC